MRSFDIVALASQIRQGEISPLDVVDYCLAQIDRYEDRVRAWVLVDAEGARAAARRAADELARGTDRGPLHGLPLGIKDIINVAGWPTMAGSPVRERRGADGDAPLVGQLRAAGAILLGKTVTTELASFDPPVTRNPWNLARTPGGSSSGSAVGVAARMCVAAIGSQTGGSITRPASFCGVAGCKPSYGVVPLAGIVPLSPRQDHPGPIGRTARDLALVLRAIADPRAKLEPPPTQSPDGRRSLRFGLLEAFFFSEAAPDVRRVTQTAVERLKAAGAEVVPVALPPSFAQVHQMHRRLMCVDAAAVHAADFASHREQFGPCITTLIAEGPTVSAAEYEEAAAHQARFRRELVETLSACDALLAPSTVTPAPGPETTGDPRFNSPWSFAGVPTVTLPCGLGDGGLPCGLQLIGLPNTDLALLEVAHWCEQPLAFDHRPPLIEGS